MQKDLLRFFLNMGAIPCGSNSTSTKIRLWTRSFNIEISLFCIFNIECKNYVYNFIIICILGSEKKTLIFFSFYEFLFSNYIFILILSISFEDVIETA